MYLQPEQQLSGWIKTLVALGFTLYDYHDENHHGGDQIHMEDDDTIFIEEDFCRQRMFVRISEGDVYYSWSIFVLEDIGMCAYEICTQWCDIEAGWLTDMKRAFSGHGFIKNGKELVLNNRAPSACFDKYKILFDLTQAGWIIATKQQAFSTYLSRKQDGRKQRLIVLWQPMEYRSVDIDVSTLYVLEAYGLVPAKLPNQQ